MNDDYSDIKPYPSFEDGDFDYIVQPKPSETWDIYKFEGTDLVGEYRVELYRGDFVCDCPGFRHRKYALYCKHVEMVMRTV